MQDEKWYKGNIHTHTTESDGDADPKTVVRWYRRHGYDFLVLSDHNHRTILDYGDGRRRPRKPLMIPGEEVSVRLRNGTVPIHINGIGITRLVEPIDAGGIVAPGQERVPEDARGDPVLLNPHRWDGDFVGVRREAVVQGRGGIPSRRRLLIALEHF